MNNRLLLTNAVIISPGLFIENGEVLLEGGKIVSAGAEKSEPDGQTEVIDLEGRFLMPGFVNPHTHLYSSLSTGLAPLAPADDFSAVLENFWWPLDAVHDEESVYCSALAGIIDAVKHGVTCIFDHHASMNFVGGSLDQIERAFSLAGLKSVCCFEVSDRSSNASVEQQIEENLRFHEATRDSKATRGMLGLHANFTLSDKTLKLASEMRASSAGPLSVHIHCGEDLSDYQFCLSEGFKGPVDRLERFGLLDEGSILAHCIHLSDRDRSILNDLTPWIVSNPESNANNRVGSADRTAFPSYLIGTDGMSFDMVASLRSQFLLGSGLSEDFEVLYNSFIEMPSLLASSFFPQTGRIEPGFDADIAVLDYIPQTAVTGDNLMGHLIYGARGGRVHMTIAGGRILYRNGALTFTFEKALTEQIKRAASALRRRYYG